MSTGAPDVLRELFRNEHAVVVIDDDLGLVRMIRSDVPLRTEEEVDTLYHAVALAVPRVDRRGLAVLVDLRRSPARNDEAFEAQQAQHRNAAFGGYRRGAALVRSAAGKLQITRLAREHKQPTPVFNDEAEALAYLARRRG